MPAAPSAIHLPAVLGVPAHTHERDFRPKRIWNSRSSPLVRRVLDLQPRQAAA